jgi:hypothetical protein
VLPPVVAVPAIEEVPLAWVAVDIRGVSADDPAVWGEAIQEFRKGRAGV